MEITLNVLKQNGLKYFGEMSDILKLFYIKQYTHSIILKEKTLLCGSVIVDITTLLGNRISVVKANEDDLDKYPLLFPLTILRLLTDRIHRSIYKCQFKPDNPPKIDETI